MLMPYVNLPYNIICHAGNHDGQALPNYAPNYAQKAIYYAKHSILTWTLI